MAFQPTTLQRHGSDSSINSTLFKIGRWVGTHVRVHLPTSTSGTAIDMDDPNVRFYLLNCTPEAAQNLVETYDTNAAMNEHKSQSMHLSRKRAVDNVKILNENIGELDDQKSKMMFEKTQQEVAVTNYDRKIEDLNVEVAIDRTNNNTATAYLLGNVPKIFKTATLEEIQEYFASINITFDDLMKEGKPAIQSCTKVRKNLELLGFKENDLCCDRDFVFSPSSEGWKPFREHTCRLLGFLPSKAGSPSVKSSPSQPASSTASTPGVDSKMIDEMSQFLRSNPSMFNAYIEASEDVRSTDEETRKRGEKVLEDIKKYSGCWASGAKKRILDPIQEQNGDTIEDTDPNGASKRQRVSSPAKAASATGRDGSSDSDVTSSTAPPVVDDDAKPSATSTTTTKED